MATATRAGLPTDAIDGVIPAAVVTPTSTGEFREMVANAALERQTMVFVGNRTKIDWGLPPRSVDLAFDTCSMPKIIEHAASDLVVRVSANVSLAELQGHLRERSQRLAIDTVVDGTTVGGMIATGISGPLRYGFGAVRDLLIGITAIRSDGVLASSGGRVVKNVAGYDLAKLYTGSYGTLGAITEAFFRLHALPEDAVYLLCALPLEQVEKTIARLIQTQAAPSALEIIFDTHHESATIGVLVEGLHKSVPQRVEAITALIGRECTAQPQRPPWWGELPLAATFKVTAEIAGVAHFLHAMRGLGERHGHRLAVRGSFGVGVLYVGLDAEQMTDEQITTIAEAIRSHARHAGGTSTLLRAPLPVRLATDVWGPVSALRLMQRIKEQFDPSYLLAPGRFVGGI